MANKADGTTRMEFKFSAESFARLEALSAITESTPAEVVRNALQLYEAAVKEMEAGGKVIIRRKDGSEVEAF